MNSEDTESSLLIRSIVSASRPATLNWRMRGQAFASSRNGMVSVTTSSSSTEFVMRSTALPESTGCVQYASTRFAPFSFSANGGLAQRVRGVDHVVHDHAGAARDSPMMFITVDTFGRGRRLSMIARSDSRRFASARARTTPPTSGETTMRSSYWCFQTSPSRIGAA
jgi:hypothetical protein